MSMPFVVFSLITIYSLDLMTYMYFLSNKNSVGLSVCRAVGRSVIRALLLLPLTPDRRTNEQLMLSQELAIHTYILHTAILLVKPVAPSPIYLRDVALFSN